jgi:hypothetical protein
VHITTELLKSIFFWDMTPCSALSGTRSFGGTYRLHLQGRRIVQHLLARCFAELFYDPEDGGDTSGTTQRTTRRHIPEEDSLQNHRCENLKS